MGIEIERKFLVDAEQWHQLEKPEGTPFEQGYLVSDGKRTVRIRATDLQGYITIKGTTTRFSRSEYEYPIPVSEARELIANLAEFSLQKTRYCIDYAGKTWEVDAFKGSNEGLLLAEIELDSEDETFDLPPWVITEVTVDKRYYNSYLSEHPYQEW
jgi:adenylate cyclase